MVSASLMHQMPQFQLESKSVCDCGHEYDYDHHCNAEMMTCFEVVKLNKEKHSMLSPSVVTPHRRPDGDSKMFAKTLLVQYMFWYTPI